MRQIISIFLLFVMFSCSEDNVKIPDAMDQSKVLMLKVDYKTGAFEAGTEIFIDEPVSDFDITTTYQSPGDFGGIQLYSANSNTLLFDGTIIWMGLGVMNYPANLQDSNSFETLTESVAMPDENLFSKVMYDEFAFYPEDMDVTSIWSAIDNLAIVKTYRENNLEAKIQVFL